MPGRRPQNQLGRDLGENYNRASVNAPTGTNCSIATYEVTVNDQGLEVENRLRSGHLNSIRRDEMKADNAAIVINRYLRADRSLDNTRLEIRSDFLQKAFRECIGAYPGVSDNGRVIKLTTPAYCLFHHRERLESYQKELQYDSLAWKHMELLLKYIEGQFASGSRVLHDNSSLAKEKATIDYDNIWMAFCPRTFVYRSNELGLNTILMVENIEQRSCNTLHCKDYKWRLSLTYIDYIGHSSHRLSLDLDLEPYNGFKPLVELEVFPLLYHSTSTDTLSALVKRGEKFFSAHKSRYMHYDGPIWTSDQSGKPTLLGTETGRVIIDTKGMPDVPSGSKRSKEPVLKKDEIATCVPIVRGFSLSQKAWVLFQVDDIKPIEWNSSAFNELCLPQEQKEKMKLWASAVRDSGHKVLDLVPDKGKSHLVLLHGPSGVGKTLSIECLADWAKRPLYVIEPSDLSQDLHHFGQKLKPHLQQAQLWDSIVLLNNADHYFFKNGPLASVLLNCLENYNGLIFLEVCDSQGTRAADIPRIHDKLEFNPPDASSRRQIWQQFLSRNKSMCDQSLLQDAAIETLAEHELNGRRIRDSFRAAAALTGKNQKLTLNAILREITNGDAATKRSRETLDDGGDEDSNGEGRKLRSHKKARVDDAPRPQSTNDS